MFCPCIEPVVMNSWSQTELKIDLFLDGHNHFFTKDILVRPMSNSATSTSSQSVSCLHVEVDFIQTSSKLLFYPPAITECCLCLWAQCVLFKPAFAIRDQKETMIDFWGISTNWARIFKLLWSPGIDFVEPIPPAYVAWGAGTIPNSYSVPSPHA
jgi:hypothetical protein